MTETSQGTKRKTTKTSSFRRHTYGETRIEVAKPWHKKAKHCDSSFFFFFNNNNQFNKTTLQYIYTLNYMAKFMKYLKIIRANNCSLLVTRTGLH